MQDNSTFERWRIGRGKKRGGRRGRETQEKINEITRVYEENKNRDKSRKTLKIITINNAIKNTTRDGGLSHADNAVNKLLSCGPCFFLANTITLINPSAWGV